MNRFFLAAVAAAVAVSHMPAAAEVQAVTGKVIYGADDRIDVYQETNANRLRWAHATCGLVSAADLTFDAATQTYTLDTDPFRQSNRPPCDGEPFADQRTAPFCSGFAAGHNIVVTAGHCVFSDDSLASIRFVFGYEMLDADTPVTTFRADQVYVGNRLLGRRNSGSQDYAVIELTTSITAPEITPRRIRREGVVPEDTLVGVIGHPSGLPMKIAFGDNTRVNDNGPSGYFTANVDTYGGNSGSPVFNAETGVVEGVLVRGAPDWNFPRGCFESNRLSDSAPGEDVSKSTTFASFVPALELENPHTADKDGDGSINLNELLRVVQFYNAGAYHCDISKSEDGFLVGPGDQSCEPHASDFIASDFVISLSELLRLVQFYSSGFYEPCDTGEDGYCAASR